MTIINYYIKLNTYLSINGVIVSTLLHLGMSNIYAIDGMLVYNMMDKYKYIQQSDGILAVDYKKKHFEKYMFLMLILG